MLRKNLSAAIHVVTANAGRADGHPRNFAQEVGGDVGVDLRGGDAAVPEHLLDGAQVGAALQQVGGEGMAQRMRGNLFAECPRVSPSA